MYNAPVTLLRLYLIIYFGKQIHIIPKKKFCFEKEAMLKLLA